MAEGPLTTVNSFPADFRNALVHLVFLGLRFFLKFLMHFDLQNLNVLENEEETCTSVTPHLFQQYK